MRYRQYGAGMAILNDVVQPEILEPRIERIPTFREGLRETRQMLHEIESVGRFVKSNGFTPGRDFQRVASIPSSVWSAVLEIFPDAGTNKLLFYALLQGPLKEYDIRNKIILW